MIESPLIQEIVSEAQAEAIHKAILHVLNKRFGEVTAELEMKVRSIADENELTELNVVAGSCLDFDTFRQAMK